jgi:hypothetical protein
MAQYYKRNTTILKVRASEIQPGDIILGPAPSDLPPDLRLVRLQQPRERDMPLVRLPRPGYLRRTSSLDRDDFLTSYRGTGTITRRRTRRRGQLDEDQYDSEGPIARRRTRRRDQPDSQDQYNSEDIVARRRTRRRDQPDLQDQYGSEGSIPPRSRRSASTKQKRQQSNRDGNASSSASSSDLGCTDDDEKSKKKAQWKKWGAIGLAGVATIHAVHGAHETFEKTQARRKELAEGEISEGEAHKKRNKAKWRTAADVGIAAVWIKSAYDEIKEYREAKKEHSEVCGRGEERHRKRLERSKAIKSGEYKGHHPLGN